MYEPSRGGGSKSYMGWTTISAAPIPNLEAQEKSPALFSVKYDRPIEYFEHPVFRLQGGIPLESWLRQYPRTSWGLKLQGRAVRQISPSDATQILRMGNNDIAARLTEYDPAEEALPERGKRLLRVAERSSTFRVHVVNNFEKRCAITGLSVHSQLGVAIPRLLHAAHIKPVADRGSDLTSNGISMTPTLHALFDEGMFTIVASPHSVLEVKVSPQLNPGMIKSKEGADLLIQDGLRLAVLPREPISRTALAYHQAKVFKG